ncbi:MAG: hypothetical protein ACREDL_20505, partial [Bradyrhizobium sp.]
MNNDVVIESVLSSARRAHAVLRCLRCGRDGVLDVRSDAASCCACSAVFPCADGVPALVRDSQKLTDAIGEARRVNPAWYVAEQPPETVSPWRHHLKKRRLYVERVIG